MPKVWGNLSLRATRRESCGPDKEADALHQAGTAAMDFVWGWAQIARWTQYDKMTINIDKPLDGIRIYPDGIRFPILRLPAKSRQGKVMKS